MDVQADKKLPSPKQMLVRAQQGHFTLLRAARDGTKVEARLVSEVRGFNTARGTLIAWDALRFDSEHKAHITQRGLALLELQEQRAALGRTESAHDR